MGHGEVNAAIARASSDLASRVSCPDELINKFTLRKSLSLARRARRHRRRVTRGRYAFDTPRRIFDDAVVRAVGHDGEYGITHDGGGNGTGYIIYGVYAE